MVSSIAVGQGYLSHGTLGRVCPSVCSRVEQHEIDLAELCKYDKPVDVLCAFSEYLNLDFLDWAT